MISGTGMAAASAGAPGWRWRWPRLSAWSTAALGAILVWLIGVPLALMAISSLKPDGMVFDPGIVLDNYQTVIQDDMLAAVLRNTAVFVGASASIALVAAFALAWLTERTDMPCRRAVRAMTILPMAMPPLLLAMAWALLMSPRSGMVNGLIESLTGLRGVFDIFSMPGMVFVQTLSMIPTAYLILMSVIRNTSGELEEAARMCGAGFWKTLFRITLPLLAPGLIATALFLVIAGIATFDIPGTLGMPVGIFVVSSQIYQYVFLSVTGLPLYGQVGVIGVALVVLMLPLVYLYQRMTSNSGRFVTITGKGKGQSRIALGKFRYAALAGASVYFLLSTVLPIGVLLWVSLMPYQTGISAATLQLLTLDNHRALLSSTRLHEAVLNTFVSSAGAAVAVVAASVWLSFLIVRVRPWGYKAMNFASFMPLALPGVLLGVALTYVYLEVSPNLWFGSVGILIVAFATSYLTYGVQSLNSALIQSSRVLEEAAQMSGATLAMTLRRVSLPLLTPAMAGVGIWVFAHGLRELTLALMLQSDRNLTVSALLWGYWSNGNATGAAAVGVWLTAVMGVLVIIWQFVIDKEGGR